MPEAPAPLAPGLYVVGTPIGNLEDITLRALRVLRQADRIACEDTRQTQKLLNHFAIQTPTISYHAHNEAERAGELLRVLKEGGTLALVSDAGMPAVSDPGHVLVAEAIAQGIPVVPIPGPTAAVAALVASGLPAEEFRFLGFPPHKAGQRRSAFERWSRDPATLVFYEAPHRILETLDDIVATCGPDRRVVLARELTKLHEEFLRGPAADVAATLRSRDLVRGEITLLVEGAREQAATPPAESLADRVRAVMREQQIDERTALKVVAKERGIGKSEAYREWQRTRAGARVDRKAP